MGRTACTQSLSACTRVHFTLGRNSSVGIATGYGAGRSGDRIPVGARFSAPVQTGPGAHPASCTVGTGSFTGVNCGRGVKLTTHPLLVPCSRKSRAIPLLPLRAVRPVQSLCACTRVHFNFFYWSAEIWYVLTSAYRYLCVKMKLTYHFCLKMRTSLKRV